MSFPEQITIVEASPREGIYLSGATVPAISKSRLIDDLASAGVASFDAVAFASPTWAPRATDGAEVVAGVARKDLDLVGLVPNMRGLEDGLAAGLTRFAVLTGSSDVFNERNLNATVDEAMHRIRRILLESPGDVSFRAYLATATHCDLEGPQDPDWVAHIAETLLEWGAGSVILAETSGRATAYDVERLLGYVLGRIDVANVGVDFHDTYGQGLTNTLTALDHHICIVQSCAGGLGRGGGAGETAGPVATEDLLWLLDGLGIGHGVDSARVADVAKRFCADNNLMYESRAGRALLASEIPA